MTSVPQLGQVLTGKRRVYAEDVAAFGDLVRDLAIQHVGGAHDDGRVIAHGLYVASVATSLGASLNYLARTTAFEFLTPVYVGDILTARVVVEDVQPAGPMGFRLSVVGNIVNQKGHVVMKLQSTGLVPRPTAPSEGPS